MEEEIKDSERWARCPICNVVWDTSSVSGGSWYPLSFDTVELKENLTIMCAVIDFIVKQVKNGTDGQG